MNKEILLVAEVVSNEKGIGQEVIFQAIEAALETATIKKANDVLDVKVTINHKTGDYQTFRRWLVVEDTQATSETFDTRLMITLSEAQTKQATIAVGEY